MEYYEVLFLTKELWEKIKESLDTEFYIYELDGKHSETEADFHVREYKEEELEGYSFGDSDGDILFNRVASCVATELDSTYRKIADLLRDIECEVRALNQYEIVGIKIHKEKLSKLEGFLDNNEGEII